MKKLITGKNYRLPLVTEISFICEDGEEPEQIEYDEDLTDDIGLKINTSVLIQGIYAGIAVIEKKKYKVFSSVMTGERILIPKGYENNICQIYI